MHWAVADFNQLLMTATGWCVPRQQRDPQTHTTDSEDLLMALKGANNSGHQLSKDCGNAVNCVAHQTTRAPQQKCLLISTHAGWVQGSKGLYWLKMTPNTRSCNHVCYTCIPEIWAWTQQSNWLKKKNTQISSNCSASCQQDCWGYTVWSHEEPSCSSHGVNSCGSSCFVIIS